MTEFELMLECIAVALDEHGIQANDGQWMTAEEVFALSDEELVSLFKQIYGKD